MAALAAASVRQKRQQRQATADANLRAIRLQQQQHSALYTDSDVDLESRFGGAESRRSSASWKDYRDGLREQEVSDQLGGNDIRFPDHTKNWLMQPRHGIWLIPQEVSLKAP